MERTDFYYHPVYSANFKWDSKIVRSKWINNKYANPIAKK